MGNCHGSSYKPSSSSSSNCDHQREKSRHEGAILGLSTTSGTVFSCSEDKSVAVSLWDYGSSKRGLIGVGESSYLNGHSRAVNRVAAFSNVGEKTMCWTASRDLSIRCWDVEDATCTRTIEGAHSLNVSAIDVGNDASTVYSGSRDYSVKAWDTETGVCKSEVSAPRNIVTALKFKSNNKLLFQGSEDLCVRVWDTRNSSKQPSMHINSFVYFPLSLALHPNENYFAAGCKGFESIGCEVKLFDLRKTLAPVAELKGHTHDVTGVSYSQNGDHLVSVSKDGSIIVWNGTEVSGRNKDVGKTLYRKLGSVYGTGKYFTDVILIEKKKDATLKNGEAGMVDIVASASDGSLSHYTLKQTAHSKGFHDAKKSKNTASGCTERDDLEVTLQHATSPFRGEGEGEDQ